MGRLFMLALCSPGLRNAAWVRCLMPRSNDAGLPAVHTPNEADIYKAIGELEKKIQQPGRNQKTIEAKLEHVAARVDAANANLIMGVQISRQR